MNEDDSLVSNCKCVMGNGNRIDFWEDQWTEVTSLRESFPRIFRIANRKSGKVHEFRAIVDEVWTWRIEIRRQLLAWEVNIWNEFMNVLNRATPVRDGEDRLKWLGVSDGKYTLKSYCLAVSCVGVRDDNIWKIVWSNIAPPKVEAFVWKAVLQRLPNIVKLLKR
ncbi:hypothetical protein F3Y22_tig00110384pilonHSYRG00826 [Hibiscus syriacus]|uniref:Uncharacterized protein n=1 Tax=Hibiscus syriacus TaxID=106335 RepID=A0A6A3AS23_HIBSY|nr:hypothetical protein F3Y22_tig00110384pilonHSYRG00826 [Hibiscus syriacus]